MSVRIGKVTLKDRRRNKRGKRWKASPIEQGRQVTQALFERFYHLGGPYEPAIAFWRRVL